MGEEHSTLRSPAAWVQIPALQLPRCVTLDTVLHLAKPEFPSWEQLLYRGHGSLQGSSGSLITEHLLYLPGPVVGMGTTEKGRHCFFPRGAYTSAVSWFTKADQAPLEEWP